MSVQLDYKCAIHRSLPLFMFCPAGISDLFCKMYNEYIFLGVGASACQRVCLWTIGHQRHSPSKWLTPTWTLPEHPLTLKSTTNYEGKVVKARYNACIPYIQGAVDHIANPVKKTGTMSFTNDWSEWVVTDKQPQHKSLVECTSLKLALTYPQE